jgi:tyrosyl-tRNA synthetase
LAKAVTALVHGPEEAEKAETAAVALFSGGGDDSSVPSTDIAASELEGEGMGLLAAMSLTGLAKSNGEARRLVKQGGVKVNDAAVKDERRVLTGDDVEEGRIRLQVGKKRHHHLVVS